MGVGAHCKAVRRVGLPSPRRARAARGAMAVGAAGAGERLPPRRARKDSGKIAERQAVCDMINKGGATESAAF